MLNPKEINGEGLTQNGFDTAHPKPRSYPGLRSVVTWMVILKQGSCYVFNIFEDAEKLFWKLIFPSQAENANKVRVSKYKEKSIDKSASYSWQPYPWCGPNLFTVLFHSLTQPSRLLDEACMNSHRIETVLHTVTTEAAKQPSSVIVCKFIVLNILLQKLLFVALILHQCHSFMALKQQY